MHKKLLSNLPFNPSLITQVSFYSKRLKAENAVRRTGFVVLSLALVVQVFAVLSPSQPTLARSNNDLIVGGISSKGEAVDHCKQNTRGYKNILEHYDITCANIAESTTVDLKSTAYNKRLFSMGHLAYGKQGETPVTIQGVGTVYLRYLWSWDTGGASTYQALKGKTKAGLDFFILYNCGNLVFIGIPPKPKPCKWNKNLPADSPKCFEPCPVDGKKDLPKDSPKCFEPCPYNKKIPANSPKCFEPCPVDGKKDLPKDSPDCFVPCKYNNTISENDDNCKPCEDAQTQTDLTACLVYSKSARNSTKNVADANGTTADKGDTIVYSLSTKNAGKETIKNYVVSENISDVLDYADVVDLHGGSINDDKIVAWPKQDIKGGQTIGHTITIRIKDELPNTPASSSDPGHFDMKMTNVYGNSVTISLPPSVIKTTEVVVDTLPNTGPGASLAIAVSITAIAGYFFSRSRLLVKEVDLVKDEFVNAGA